MDSASSVTIMPSTVSPPSLARVDLAFTPISRAVYSYVSRRLVLSISCCTSRCFKNSLKEDLILLTICQLTMKTLGEHLPPTPWPDFLWTIVAIATSNVSAQFHWRFTTAHQPGRGGLFAKVLQRAWQLFQNLVFYQGSLHPSFCPVDPGTVSQCFLGTWHRRLAWFDKTIRMWYKPCQLIMPLHLLGIAIGTGCCHIVL